MTIAVPAVAIAAAVQAVAVTKVATIAAVALAVVTKVVTIAAAVQAATIATTTGMSAVDPRKSLVLAAQGAIAMTEAAIEAMTEAAIAVQRGPLIAIGTPTSVKRSNGKPSTQNPRATDAPTAKTMKSKNMNRVA